MASAPDPPVPGGEPVGTVLCIEDNAINRCLISDIVARWPGVRLLEADTGREGVALALAQRPDIVLLDMRLPDIDGVEVVRALSEQISRRRLRVILLTGEAFTIDVAKAMSLGAHDYWRKPLDIGKLERVLRDLLAARAPRAGGLP